MSQVAPGRRIRGLCLAGADLVEGFRAEEALEWQESRSVSVQGSQMMPDPPGEYDHRKKGTYVVEEATFQEEMDARIKEMPDEEETIAPWR